MPPAATIVGIACVASLTHETKQPRKEKKRKAKKRKAKKRKEKKRKEKKTKEKDYASWRQFNEEPSIILGCPGTKQPVDAKSNRSSNMLVQHQLYRGV